MAVEIVTREDLQQFRIQLLNDLKFFLKPIEVQPEKSWLKSGEVRKLLKISPNTLQSLRTSGKLHPSKVGGILYYQLDEINELLNQSNQRA